MWLFILKLLIHILYSCLIIAKMFYFLLAVAYVWIIQNLILMKKLTCKRKWMSWLGWTRQCKKNWKQYHIQNQSKFLPWYLDKWSRMYCSEYYFNILEYLVWTSHEIKKVREILAKPAPEKRGSYRHWNTSSSNKRFWR